MPCISTSEEASKAIDSVVKNLNAAHFLDEMDVQNFGDVDEIDQAFQPPVENEQPPVGNEQAIVPPVEQAFEPSKTKLSPVDNQKSIANEETFEDIVNVLVLDPSILDTQNTVALPINILIEREKAAPAKETDSDKANDDETIGDMLKRTVTKALKGKNKISATTLGKGMSKAVIDEDQLSAASILQKMEDKGILPAVAVQVNKPRHTMMKRSDAEKKKGNTMLSPFNERAVSVTNKLTNKEKDMYQWLQTYSEDSDNDVLFNDENVVAYRLDLKTLKLQTYLSAGVIGAWSCHLNFQERLRSQESPSRFFFTTFPRSFLTVDRPTRWTLKSFQNSFNNLIESEMKVVCGFKIDRTDMVFFPISKSVDFYVICVDIKRKMVVLWDNSSVADDEPLNMNYGDIPSAVVKLFCQWLISKNYYNKGRSLINLPIQRLKLPWRDENKVDCGVYAMRHMETYMGQRLREWKIGFEINAGKTLQDLRVKYSKVLLTSEANHLRNNDIGLVESWFKGFRNVTV